MAHNHSEWEWYISHTKSAINIKVGLWKSFPGDRNDFRFFPEFAQDLIHSLYEEYFPDRMYSNVLVVVMTVNGHYHGNPNRVRLWIYARIDSSSLTDRSEIFNYVIKVRFLILTDSEMD